MKFKANSRRRAIEYEKDLVRQWKKSKTFEKSIEQRPKENAYVFYDGPPFITGSPHFGTLLSSVVKDVVPRYQTMKGKRVERKWGWDCHGLPAETFTEKKLGITDRREIGTRISLEDYIRANRENMVQTGSEWEDTIDRVGRWVDFKGAYKTMDKDFMESVWWAFKELHDKGKIYEGERVLMYCTRDATPLSKNEVTMDPGAYQEVTDPSVYVRFHLKPNQEFAKGKYKTKEAAYMLAWTTTPWTLQANTALAVGKKLSYTALRIDGIKELLIVASDRVEDIFREHDVEIVHNDLKGGDLVGLEYEPLFEDRGKNAHKVWHADYVSAEDGSGIVHLAPAYGEEDFALAQENKIPIVHVLDESGTYTEGEWKGKNVWEVNKTIAKGLHAQGTVWKIDYIQHSYPHCYRCGTRLMYRAHPSWFMDIQSQKQQMLVENSENITWFPQHIKHGRFEKTIQTAPDWNLSRDRFWATAMPVWKGTDKDGKEHVKVVGSYAELKALSGVELEDYHRPWVDAIEFDVDGVHYTRIDKVMDCWFESGSMPFAQFHYPFENKEKFEANFPGDFIVEYVGQVRAWFYYVHAVNVGLFGKNAFKNVIVTGNLAGNDGRKMSKSYGNYTDPNVLMDEYSADSVRFLLLQSPLLNGEDFSLQDKEVGDVARKLSMVWNMYDFFTMYAEVDGWEWDGKHQDPTALCTNPLDTWIISRVHQLTKEVEKHMNAYDLPSAVKPILPFIDDASNWYVRRSRRRFWKSGDGADKDKAYRTLHYVLVQLSLVLAPFTPFLAEELYQKLTAGESVHLLDWPKTGHIDELLIDHMKAVRHLITVGLGLRAEGGIKVRQPLASATIKRSYHSFPPELLEIISEELNIKDLKVNTKHALPEKPFVENLTESNFAQLYQIELDTKLTPSLLREGMMREVVRQVQNARKQAGLQVDDRIKLSLYSSDVELSKAIDEYKSSIAEETLATSLENSEGAEVKQTLSVKMNNTELLIGIEKA